MSVAANSCVDERSTLHNDFRIALPPADLVLAQDEEWCVVRLNGKWREIRLHDYDEIFSIPGLYERLIYDILKCDSPATIRRILQQELATSSTETASLRVLDLGAGNGMVGEELADMGVECVVGADIIEAAAVAAERDRPGLFAPCSHAHRPGGAGGVRLLVPGFAAEGELCGRPPHHRHRRVHPIRPGPVGRPIGTPRNCPAPRHQPQDALGKEEEVWNVTPPHGFKEAILFNVRNQVHYSPFVLFVSLW